MIAVVDSGSGNLGSVARALTRVGAPPVVTSDPEVVRRADRVVVPGQGAFRDCMAGLSARGLDEALREVIARGTPYLGICLGLQILFEESEEQGPCAGLGLLGGRVVRFSLSSGGLKIPHMGWNQVSGHDPLIDDGAHVYFVHSYHAVPSDRAVVATTTEYGGKFTSAVRKDNLFAVQFHPEKSQRAGLTLLERFVR